MPNWCAGDLRVRGTKENLIKFILDGLNPIKNICNELEPLKINENGEICGGTCHIKELIEVLSKAWTSMLMTWRMKENQQLY